MSDPNRLEQIAEDLRKVAKQCTDAEHTLQQQAQQLDWSAQDLAEGVGKWAGKGSQSFLNAWYQYHQDTRRSATSLDQTAQALNKLAQTIEDNVQAIRNAQAKEAAGFLITGGLVLLDIAQLGLDPVTDAATVGAGGADAALIEEAQAAEEAIVEMDSQVSGEIDDIASQVENSSEPGDVNVPDGGNTDGIDMNDDSGNTDTGGGSDNNGGNNGGSKTSTGGDDESAKGFADQNKLTGHFNKHNSEFNPPFADEQEYEQAANKFLSGDPAPGVLQRVRPNGDIVRFNPTTNEFGVVSKDGVVRTYFIPDPIKTGMSNLDYFLNGK